jgi:hypothetical protein
MSTNLTNKDYKNILKYYNKNISKSSKTNKRNAEKILATKLCRCIKSFNTSDESKGIRICTSKIFQNRGLKRGKFTCKKKYTIKLRKNI